ncbi:MAG: uroporphyrinogen-III C-methyltransferase [Gammaproteobacteria bacterium]|nr:uroporphyrinogen-III C-methyltransferase [Gammaproteobacteria bacterium]
MVTEQTNTNTQTVPVDETTSMVNTVNPPPSTKKITLGSIVLTFTLIGLLAIAGVGYLLWNQLRSQQEGLGGSVDKGDKRVIELRKQINNTQTHLSNVEQQLTVLTEAQNNKDQQYERLLSDHSKKHEDRLQNHHAKLDVKLHNIERQLGKTRGDWLIADAEYLLSVANERLQLTQDINTTIMALEAADHRLRESGDGGVFKVREEIASEISALKKIKVPDIVGLIHTISILQKDAKNLQLALPTMDQSSISQGSSVKSANDKVNSSESDPLDTVITDLKELVVIRPRNPDAVSILHSEEARIIREDYLIRLEIAKAALARRSEQEFLTSLQSSKDWLNEHFNTKSDAVNNAIKTIDGLLKTKFHSQLPDISRSLKLLRDLAKFRINADHLKGVSDQEKTTEDSKSAANSESGQIKKAGDSAPKTGAVQ